MLEVLVFSLWERGKGNFAAVTGKHVCDFLLLRITYILRKEGRKLPFKNCEVFKDRQEMY